MATDTFAEVGVKGLKPPLKWAGGKRWLIPHLRPYWEKESKCRLVEPFCGGLAVALGLRPRKALLNDIDPHLINFFKWIQSGLEMNLEMTNDKTLYYSYRSTFNRLIHKGKADSALAAQLFYYLNRTGYNGLCRFNRKGEFNVPFGRYNRITYQRDFSEYREAFSQWEFRCGDFEEIKLDPHDFIYADPPYDVEFTNYSKEGFTWEDQIRLAQWLARHKGTVLLSNQATDRIVRLYDGLGFRLIFLEAPRMISCTGERARAKEVLAVKGI